MSLVVERTRTLHLCHLSSLTWFVRCRDKYGYCICFDELRSNGRWNAFVDSCEENGILLKIHSHEYSWLLNEMMSCRLCNQGIGVHWPCNKIRCAGERTGRWSPCRLWTLLSLVRCSVEYRNHIIPKIVDLIVVKCCVFLCNCWAFYWQ